MRPHTIRYRITPQARDQHERLLGELMAELETSPVPGLRYEVFRLGDEGLEYLHLVVYDKAGHGPLRRPPALADFHEALRERCDSEPRREELEPVRSPAAARELSADANVGMHHDHWRRMHG